MPTICPSAEELARIGRTDTGSCAPGLATHIERCPDCQDFLKRRVQDGLETLGLRAGELPRFDTTPQIDGFTLERELGRGAMGVVYLAHRDAPRRPVALKLLPGGRHAGPRERRQWRREAEAASRVRHPNIVTLHETGEADDCFWLVLEYIPGGTLADRLSAPLEPADAARLMVPIARAVHHLHRHGQLHLDLKPSNILLDGEAGAGWEGIIPKVSDFGIAHTAGPGATDTVAAGAGGTPPYMAPEQITRPRQDLSPSADIHALGAILYHLLTGVVPYHGATVLDTLEQVRNQEPVPPRRLVAQIPRDLETIALKCLQKTPSARYASAEALADDLIAWLDGRPITARPVSPLGKAWRWCCRRPVIAALTTLLVLTLSIGFTVVVLLWRHAEAERRRAEDDLRFAGLMLNEITALETPHPAQTLVEVLQRTQERLVSLRMRRPEDPQTCQQLAQINLALAFQFTAQGQLAAARSSLVECLENLARVLNHDPQDRTALNRRFSACQVLSSVAEEEGKREESHGHLERAVTYGQECVRLPKPTDAMLRELAECRWALAQSLNHQGDRERARSLIHDNFRMLDAALKDNGGPVIAIWRTLARLDLKEFDENAPSISPAGEPGADDWAQQLAQSLSFNPSNKTIYDNILIRLTDCLHTRIATQRRLGRINEARLSACQMLALGSTLVEQCPDRAGFHLALCAAFTQMAKNAWMIDDVPAVERNWKSAIDEAREALHLDPKNVRASTQAADLRRRLDELQESK